jgi:hypothetical protein
MKKFIVLTIAVMGIGMFTCPSVFALSFNFADIPPDNGINLSSSFSGEMVEYNDQVLFRIFNNVASPSTIFIGKVFFDFEPDDLLTLIGFDITHSVGDVSFVPKTGGTFPQGSNLDPKFLFDVQQVADNGGTDRQGIDDGEVGAFLFAGDFVEAEAALLSGDLRVGIHAQGIPFGEGSDSYVSTAPVPEPSTILLMGAGLLGLVGFNRKRFSKKS